MIDPELKEEIPSADARTLRQFAGLWLLFFTGLALWSAGGGHPRRAIVSGVLALAVGPWGLIAPEAIAPLFRGLIVVTQPLGIVLTRVILAVLFYGLFTPLALLFRWIGRDALDLKRPDGKTYWRPKLQETQVRRYLRQF